MPCIQFFADHADFNWVLSRLNDDPDIAWIVSDGMKRWRAIQAINTLEQKKYCLWHVPSGPLPLVGARRIDRTTGEIIIPEPSEVADPWSGWKGSGGGFDHALPYFGPAHYGVYWLTAAVPTAADPKWIGLSSIEWAKEHLPKVYADTQKWWRQLHQEISQHATEITQEGPLDGSTLKAWAFSGALERIHAGTERRQTAFDKIDRKAQAQAMARIRRRSEALSRIHQRYGGSSTD